jgi:kynurenine formamidase
MAASPPGCWVLMRTDWSKRSRRGLSQHGRGWPHSPGPTPDAIRLLLARDIRGFGTETVGTDAGQGMHYDPPYPAHYLLHGAGKLRAAVPLPISTSCPRPGAVLIAPPLKIKGGTGSPLRVLALRWRRR